MQIYSPLVFFWARRLGLTEGDAADVVQEVWHSVAAAMRQFQRDHSSGSFRGWLWTISRNKVTDHFRKHHNDEVAMGGTDAKKVLETIPDHELTDETGVEDHGLLHRALDLIRSEFEPRTWTAFWRMVVDGQPAADVGQELDLKPNAVHQAKFRVLRRLREEMDGLF